MLDVVGYYACCVGNFGVLWWIITTVVPLFAYCDGSSCVRLWIITTFVAPSYQQSKKMFRQWVAPVLTICCCC